ncbi:uncharacterized protein B0P05DRAFT_584972 [Gilbertella persicaria]|uniref:uncharacterized protein n=1 Tax=Gilbertella persicaria TaxID=101096 RepID=UPI002220061D|nr:uncharacterized protein B0P05DRAFT_584972 [Gilbertella persicaria]KAI8087755.1 hypothetical protein B0P05DRAFT_584972 [Gilbertella persicaria]
MDSPDKFRALKAEKQVERLERELELVRSKKVASSNLRDTDKLVFQLQEQVKDLKYQLKHQLSENSKYQETLSTRTNEYEEKLKRMREIFGQASRNIDQYRATIASKDTDIDKLKNELEECQIREQSFKSLSESQQLSIEKLNTVITSEKTFYGSEIKQLEAKNRQLANQLQLTKTDYEQYKKRAHVLLNQEQKSDQNRLNELQELVEQLQAQRIKHELEQQEKAEHQLLLEHDLRKAIDRIHELEKQHGLLTKQSDLKQKSIQETFEIERQHYESKLQSLNSIIQQKTFELDHRITIQPEQRPSQEQQERIDKLEQLNQSLQQQLVAKENEIQTLLVSTPSSPKEEEHILPLPNASSKKEFQDVYASMSSLLSPLVSRQIPDERMGLEKQVQRLSQMLHESEDKVMALKHQEKVLKDELRKMDGFEKRQDMNNEYLKNVLIKFLLSDNKPAMVPILAKLLCLDETETSNLMSNCI